MKSQSKVIDKIRNTILIFIVLSILGCGSSDQEMIQAARSYLDQNKLREAALELKNALQENPENAEARYILGVINLDMGDMATAEKEFRRAAEAGWDEGQARIGQARSMISGRAFQKLLDEIEVSENYSNEVRADIEALRALAIFGLGNAVQAVEILNEAVKIDGSAFSVLKASIQINLATNNLEQAIESLKKAQGQYGDNKEVLLLNAIISARSDELDKAAEAYKKIIELEPEKLITIYGKQARLGLARYQVLNKEYDNANITLKPLLAQAANDPEVNFVGGLLAFEQRDLEAAEERLLKVLKVAPDHAQTLLLFGAVNYAQEDYEQAAYYLAKYISVAPENLGARKILGRAYIKLGQHTEAQATLQSGLEDGNDDAELLALVGISQLQAGDIAASIEGLEKAVKAAPESDELRSELARAYISAGETENAIAELKTILAEGDDKEQAEILLIATHLRAKQYDQAIGFVLDMLQKNPDDPAVLSLTGNVFAISGDNVEARKYFNKALQIKPDYIPANMLLARVEEIDGQPDKAEEIYKNVAVVSKDDISPVMALARLAETQNQTEKMIKWLEDARKRAPNNVKPNKILSEYYLREEKLEKAGVLIKDAIKKAPRDRNLLVLQARWQIADRQYNNALSTLNELVIRVPESVFVRTMLAETYYKLAQLADARRQLDIVLEKQPHYTPALILMSSLELQSGNYNEALAIARKIQTVKPNLHLGFELAGDAMMMKKEYAAAKKNYELAMRQKQFAELVIKISEAAARAGELSLSTKPLLDWLGEHPDDVRVLQFLGNAYQSLKQNKNAIDTYEKILVLQSDNVAALNNLAWVYLLENNSKAFKLAEKAYERAPNDVGVNDTYGWALVQQGQIDKGVRLLEKAMAALPDVPEVQYHYAVALLKSGEEVKAREMLGKLLSGDKSFVGRTDAEQLMRKDSQR